MRGRSMALALAAALLLGGGAGQAEPTADGPEAAAQARAKQATLRLMQTVFAELVSALDQGPAEHAVHVCHESAQHVTAEVAAKEGLSVRRVALRLRNPLNAPDELERRVMEGWLAAGGTMAPHSEVAELPEGGRELRYLQPIVLQPLCTSCHGTAEQISQEVRRTLAERYPEDQATDFQPGELRGAVSVRVPVGEP
jgi:hypothetical protein